MKTSFAAGRQFGRLTVIAESSTRKKHWVCRCICGVEKEISAYSLMKELTRSCGCLNNEVRRNRGYRLEGRRFGRLVAQHLIEPDSPTRLHWRWRCLCDCGNATTVRHADLLSGNTVSCGCRRQEVTDNVRNIAATHRCTHHPLYATWVQMMQRCYDPKNTNYYTYGARGITVCERWHDIRNFIADMGPRPAGLMLERKDNNAGYSPENCRWATFTEQIRNRTITRKIEFRGEIKPLSVWCEEFGIPYKVAHARLNRYHWTVERALTTPLSASHSDACRDAQWKRNP